MQIEELLEQYGIEFAREGEHHHARPGWLQLRDCPSCGSDNYHLGFNLAAQRFNCWRCGGLDFARVLVQLGALSWQDAKALHKELDAGAIPQPERKRGKLKEPARIRALLPCHRLYLQERGFDPETIVRLWHVKGIGIASCLSWRLYIPIIYRGEQVSWTTRAIGKRVAQRYISASAAEEAINHKSLVYGIDYCRHSVVIVEGPTDAWAVGPGAGALFGTAFTPAQIRLLVEVPNRFVCFDSAPPAQAKAQELASLLSTFPGRTENVILDAKDPGSAPRKELRLLRELARL